MIICKLQSLIDRKLVYRDKEGILDRYTYLYDLLENKTGFTQKTEDSWNRRKTVIPMVMMSLETVSGKKKAWEDPPINIIT